MIEGLRPYGEYKESGLPWLSRIPRSWHAVRNGSLFSQRNETRFPHLPILEVSLRTGVKVRDFETSHRKQVMSDFSKYKRVVCGDLAYNMMRMWQGAVGVAPVDGLVSPAYVVARPLKTTNAHYFRAQFRMDLYLGEIDGVSKGIVKDRNRLYWDQFKQMRSVAPPPDEQLAIVRFLDHANGKIDRFIRAKRKLIGLLNEQKQAIIHRAVTRGLNPNAPLKPSGVPWLGEIPRHWEVRRLRTIVRKIEQGVSPQATGFLAECDTWGVLKSGCVNHGVFRQTEHKQLSTSFVVDPAIVVSVGDVLISRACGSPKLVGSVGKVHSLDYKLILSDKTFRAVFGPTVDTDFMVYAMNCSCYRQQVEQAISGAEGMANNLPLSELRSFVFPIPPLLEAKGIADNLERSLTKFTTAIARTEREIALMQEYRTRLTADVVTGKLDVREAAARLPEPQGEPLSSDEIDPSSDLLEDSEPDSSEEG
jgi:type I restriction enzyme S subunit